LSQNIGSGINVKDLLFDEVYTVKEIKIQLFGIEVLSLAEVEVFGRQSKTNKQITGGIASQSSTLYGANATRAIDGNKDQLWSGGSVTHTEEEIDPWWKWTLDQSEEVQGVVIYNRGDCCGNRLDNARVQLYDSNGGILLSQNIGSGINVKDLLFDEVYTVKEIKIQLFGIEVLSLAEVEVFGRQPTTNKPDYAHVLAYVSGSNVDISCNSTPQVTNSPSTSPLVSSQPSIDTAIPKGVILWRDNKPCVYEQSWPRFKCPLKQTITYNVPGPNGDNPVLLYGKGGCGIEIQPIAWAWFGVDFYFNSSETLVAINACFISEAHLRDFGSPSAAPSDFPAGLPFELPSPSPSVLPIIGPSTSPSVSSQPSIYTAIPKDVILWRDNGRCVYEEVWPRFKCSIKQTNSNSKPYNTFNNVPVLISGKDGCVIEIQPVSWAYNGIALYFEASETLAAINACFAPETRLTEFRSSSAVPSNVPLALPSGSPFVSLSMLPSALPSTLPVMAPITSPPTPSCPTNKTYLLIKIKTDQYVKDDKTKWVVLERRKKTPGFKWKQVSGLSGSLKKDKNTVVYEGKCLKVSKCYKVKLSERKNSSNPGMSGYLQATFGGDPIKKDNWTSGKAFTLKVGVCDSKNVSA